MGELERVVLTIDLAEHGLKTGDIGTVVLVHGENQGYEVEFVTLTGETVAVVLPRSQTLFRLVPKLCLPRSQTLFASFPNSVWGRRYLRNSVSMGVQTEFAKQFGSQTPGWEPVAKTNRKSKIVIVNRCKGLIMPCL
jgi:hypothetical protein